MFRFGKYKNELTVFSSVSSHFLLHLKNFDKQNEIQSTMDETKDNRTIIIGYTKKATIKTRRFIFKEILNTTNTGNSGENWFIYFYFVRKKKWLVFVCAHVWSWIMAGYSVKRLQIRKGGIFILLWSTRNYTYNGFDLTNQPHHPHMSSVIKLF